MKPLHKVLDDEKVMKAVLDAATRHHQHNYCKALAFTLRVFRLIERQKYGEALSCIESIDRRLSMQLEHEFAAQDRKLEAARGPDPLPIRVWPGDPDPIPVDGVHPVYPVAIADPEDWQVEAPQGWD